MAKTDSGGGNGHDENTAPKSVDGHKFTSPATYIPLPSNATSVNVKTPSGEKGK